MWSKKTSTALLNNRTTLRRPTTSNWTNMRNYLGRSTCSTKMLRPYLLAIWNNRVSLATIRNLWRRWGWTLWGVYRSIMSYSISWKRGIGSRISMISSRRKWKRYSRIKVILITKHPLYNTNSIPESQGPSRIWRMLSMISTYKTRSHTTSCASCCLKNPKCSIRLWPSFFKSTKFTFQSLSPIFRCLDRLTPIAT